MTFKPEFIQGGLSSKMPGVIRAIAMPMSVSTLKLLIARYPAFAAGFPTQSSFDKYVKFDKTNKEYQILEKYAGFVENHDEDNRDETVIFQNLDTNKTGWSHCRSKSDIPGQMYFNSATGLIGNHDPNNPHNNPVFSLDAFIRPEVRIVYNNDSCKATYNLKKRTSKVYANPDKSIYFKKNVSDLSKETVTSEAPIVILGGRTYIWLNFSECHFGTCNEMLLVSEHGYSIAPPFNLKGRTSNLMDAKDLLNAYNEEFIKTLSEKEKKLVIISEYKSADNFDIARRIQLLGEYEESTKRVGKVRIGIQGKKEEGGKK